MEPVSASPTPAREGPGQPPRQRWRLALARSTDAPTLGGRDLSDLWEFALDTTGLPLHRPAGRIRKRLAFGAPLPLGMAAERELADLFLADRVPLWEVRAALAAVVPEGWRLVDLYDVWVAGPPLAGRVIAADYRIELDEATDLADLSVASTQLLSARELPRMRAKGAGSVAYDLRPLLADLAIEGVGASERARLRVRTRIHPTLGTGRPEEVVAELGDRLGRSLEVSAIIRERLILSGAPD